MRNCAWCSQPFESVRCASVCADCKTRQCRQCDGTFIIDLHKNQRNKVLCSSSCASRWNALHSPTIRSAFEQGRADSIVARAEHLSILYKGKPNLALRGRTRGGQHSATNEIRRGHEYRGWRTAVYERDDYTCQRCPQRGGPLHAHHIKSYADHPDLRFVVENGETLCVDCHMEHHHGLG